MNEINRPLGEMIRRPARGAIDRRFDRGVFAYHRGDYTVALVEFERALDSASRMGEHARFVECCTYTLRILAEREEFAKIDRTEERVAEILATTDLPLRLKSRATYVLGICCCYQDHRHDEAMRLFRESINFAIQSGDNAALVAPLYGAATVLYANGSYEEALKELERLDILLSCIEVPEVASAAKLLRAMIRRNQQRLDEAIDAAWAAFESLKHHPHFVLYLHTLCVLGSIFQLKGDLASARLYMDLASRGLKRSEFPRIARLIDESLMAVGASSAPRADIIFDTRTGVLVEKSKGEIRFEGQFVLRDLLRVFLENPGQVFTKEELVRRVWSESYEPESHDNKIYVTIKRLRKLLESPENSKDYILRAKTGYFLNPKVIVQINDQMIGNSGATRSGALKSESV